MQCFRYVSERELRKYLKNMNYKQKERPSGDMKWSLWAFRLIFLNIVSRFSLVSSCFFCFFFLSIAFSTGKCLIRPAFLVADPLHPSTDEPQNILEGLPEVFLMILSLTMKSGKMRFPCHEESFLKLRVCYGSNIVPRMNVVRSRSFSVNSSVSLKPITVFFPR